MKKTILLLILSASIYAQKPMQQLTAGDELIKAKKHFYIGTAMACVGSVFALYAANQITSKIDNQGRLVYDDAMRPMVYVGEIISAFGVVFVLESFSHIGRAGIKLNESKSIVLGVKPYGASVALRF